MILKLFSLLNIIALCCSPLALAAKQKTAATEQGCGTPTVAMDKAASPPKTIRSTNNLRRAPGSITVASGKPIVIYGVVQDEHCVPISDARVEVWQAKGTASGVSNSDNMGQFTFFAAIPPGFSGGKLWHVRIKRPNAPAFKTVLYLGDGNSNYAGPTAQPDKLGLDNPQFGAPYNVKITLKTGKQYRKY